MVYKANKNCMFNPQLPDHNRKHFLYTNAINKKIFQFADYINLVCDKIEIEKYISVVTNTPTIFVKKWCRFIH